MNAEYTRAGKLVEFTVVVAVEGEPPRTTKISERSTCGKYVYEHILVYDHYDITRDVAVYNLLGTGKRPA